MANIELVNLKESDYFYGIDDLDFYFSAKFYLDRFKKEYQEYIRNEQLRLSNQYKSDVIADELFLISLYKKIEKRGFRVYYKDKELKYFHIKCILEVE